MSDSRDAKNERRRVQGEQSAMAAAADESSPWYGWDPEVVQYYTSENSPAGFDADSRGFVPGQVLDPSYVAQVIGRLNQPGHYDGVNGMTLEKYLADPRAHIYQNDNGQFIYSPHRDKAALQGGDFVSTDRESFIESLGAIPMLASFMAGPFMQVAGLGGVGAAAGAAGGATNGMSGIAGLLGIEGTGNVVLDKLISTAINTGASTLADKVAPGTGSLVGLASTVAGGFSGGGTEGGFGDADIVSSDMPFTPSGGGVDFSTSFSPVLSDFTSPTNPVTTPSGGGMFDDWFDFGGTSGGTDFNLADEFIGTGADYGVDTGAFTSIDKMIQDITNSNGAFGPSEFESWFNTAPTEMTTTGGGVEIPGAAKSVLGKLFNSLFKTDQTDDMWKRILGGGAGALTSYLGGQAQKDIYERQLGLGAPYRDKLSTLYSNPSEWIKTNVGPVADQMAEVLGRKWSVSAGNPGLSPTARISSEQDLASLGLNALNTEKNTLGSLGGLTRSSPDAGIGGLSGATSGQYSGVGGGLGAILSGLTGSGANSGFDSEMTNLLKELKNQWSKSQAGGSSAFQTQPLP